VPAARSLHPSPTPPQPASEARELSPFASDLMLVLARYTVGELPFLIPALFALGACALLGLDPDRIAGWLQGESPSPLPLVIGLAAIAFSLPLSLAIEAGMARALGRVKEGTVSLRSWAYVRVRAKTELARAAGAWLAGSLLWPLWLRWAGAKIGRGCEISTLIDIVPELIEIGPGTFLADGIYLGGPRLDRGTATLAVTRIGKGVFAGNHVVIPAGQCVADAVLLGICTVADGGAMPEGTSWFGHPPFELPKREVVSMDRSLTYAPSALLYATRAVWELARVKLPLPPAVAALAWLRVVETSSAAGPALIAGVTTLATLGVFTSLCMLTLAVKWVLVGRVRPGQHAFWSCWCGRWDYMYVTWEDWARRPLALLEGTLLLSWYLRAMGAKLGKRVVLGPGMAQVVDPDMLIIEDGATVSAMFQAHTFEDRVLKIDKIRIGRNAALGSAAVPLYGAEIGEGAHVAAGSVIMKHEHLTPGVHYEGAPAHDANA
jgi:non-ribosomal peptide synthetase-like protein